MRVGQLRSRGALALIGVLAGCGAKVDAIAAPPTENPVTATSTPISGATGGAEDWRAIARQTLAGWENFPVDSDPRPVVLLGDTADRYDFNGSGRAKADFISGNWTGPSALPSSPPTYDGYPIITAARAVEALRAENAPGTRASSSPLTITAMELGEVGVATDRGQRNLPSWRFTMTGVHGKVSVPALAAPASFPIPSGLTVNELGDHASTDGSGLTVNFVGAAAGTGPCTADYRVDTVESAHAVAYHVVEVPRPAPPPAPGGMLSGCSAVGHLRQATTQLQAPLGNRVLIEIGMYRNDPEGPVPVDPQGP